MNDERRISIRERFTRIEFVVVIFVVVVTLLVFFTAIPRALALRNRQSCQANLKTIGEAMRMYSAESKGEFYPRAKMKDCAGNVQPWSGALDLASFYPEYLKDLDLLVCPSYPAGESALEIWDQGKTTNRRWKAMEGFSNNGIVEPCELLAKPYYYYGWAFSEATFEAVTRYEPPDPEDERPPKDRGVPVSVVYDHMTHDARFKTAVMSLAKKQRAGAMDATSRDWNLEYASGRLLELPMGSKIQSLREGVERSFVRDIGGGPDAVDAERARIVVLHEELFQIPENLYHAGGFMNILYMDGHVESREWQTGYAAKFPFNEAGYILRDAVEGILIDPKEAPE